jgi:hypothetical protein
MLEGLSGVFLPRQVVLLSMLLRSGTMSMCGQIMEFSGSPM